jgi:hypothetical protein
MPRSKPATREDITRVKLAINHLRFARDFLKASGASKRCVDRVRLALTSAGGALRHVQGRALR